MQRKDIFDKTRTVEEVEKSEAGCALALEAIADIAAVVCDDYFCHIDVQATVDAFCKENKIHLSGMEQIALASFMCKIGAAMRAIKHISMTQLEILYGD